MKFGVQVLGQIHVKGKMPTVSTHGHTSITTQWRFICQTRGGTLYLHLFELLRDDKGSTVLEKPRKEYYRIKLQPPYKTWEKVSFLWKPVLKIVAISAVYIPLSLQIYERKSYSYSLKSSTTDVESQSGPRPVVLSSRNRDPKLTTALPQPWDSICGRQFYGGKCEVCCPPSGFSLAERMAGYHDGAGTEAAGDLGSYPCSNDLCYDIGVVVGILMKSVDLGVAITSGIATIAACVQVFGFQV